MVRIIRRSIGSTELVAVVPPVSTTPDYRRLFKRDAADVEAALINLRFELIGFMDAVDDAGIEGMEDWEWSPAGGNIGVPLDLLYGIVFDREAAATCSCDDFIRRCGQGGPYFAWRRKGQNPDFLLAVYDERQEGDFCRWDYSRFIDESHWEEAFARWRETESRDLSHHYDTLHAELIRFNDLAAAMLAGDDGGLLSLRLPRGLCRIYLTHGSDHQWTPCAECFTDDDACVEFMDANDGVQTLLHCRCSEKRAGAVNISLGPVPKHFHPVGRFANRNDFLSTTRLEQVWQEFLRP